MNISDDDLNKALELLESAHSLALLRNSEEAP